VSSGFGKTLLCSCCGRDVGVRADVPVICGECWDKCRRGTRGDPVASRGMLCKWGVTDAQLQEYIDTWKEFEMLRESLREA
jgi:hypothetical protein